MGTGQGRAGADASVASVGWLLEFPVPRLSERRREWLAYALAFAVGLVLDAMIFSPASTLALHSWDQALTGDAAQHAVGQRAFIADAWRWPLLTTKLLQWPEGVNISLTDSIPLVAIAAKLLRFALPPGFHAIFLWVAISFALQPLAAVFALRSAGEKRLVPALAVAVVAASMPTLLFRYGHSALCAHFLLLAALGLYFRLRRGETWAQWVWSPVLLVVSLLVHPYLLFMVAAVLAAAPASLVLNFERSWFRAALALFAAAGITLGVAWLLGYGGAGPPEGFGIYSMNLWSPVRPFASGLFPGFPQANATDGQYEGYQYLGAGVLLLTALAIPCLCIRPRLLRRHAGLLLATGALTLLALSHVVYAGHHRVLRLEHVPVWLNQLRSSGRLFWPVAYMLMLGGIVLLGRTLPGFVLMPVLATAAVLQFADASILRTAARSHLQSPGEWQIDAGRLRPLIASHHLIAVWPPLGCAVERPGGALQVLLLASEYGVRANTALLARRKNLPCEPAAILDHAVAPGELRVFRPEWAVSALATENGERDCRLLGELAVCAADRDAIADLPPVAAPAVPFDTTIAAGSALGAKSLGLGWEAPNPVGAWSTERDATITLRLEKPASAPVGLTVWLRSVALADEGQTVSLSVNRAEIARWTFEENRQVELSAMIPAPSDPSLPLKIRFHIANPVRPVDRGWNSDTRTLGVLLTAYRLTPGL